MLDDLKEQFNTSNQISLNVKVHAGAKENRIKSILSDGTVKVDITTVPEDGKANDALISLLACEFNVNNSCIQIVAGKFSADKVVKIFRCSY